MNSSQVSGHRYPYGDAMSCHFMQTKLHCVISFEGWYQSLHSPYGEKQINFSTHQSSSKNPPEVLNGPPMYILLIMEINV
jgi:hypothetical protein